jgi:hypothetical protein
MKKMFYLVAVCLLVAALALQVFAKETLEQQIAALPSVEEFKAMSQEQQVDAYNRTQYAYEAYMALSTAEEKEALEGAEEKFDALFSFFNAQIMPIETEAETGKVGYNQFAWLILAALAAMLLVTVLRKKPV